MLTFYVVISLVTLANGAVDLHLQEMYEKMPRNVFIEYFNNLNHSYTITQHNISHFFGVEIDHEFRKNLTVIEHDKSEDLPENFDAREKWSSCVTVREKYEQGMCQSCWAFGAANTASDRTCVQKNVTVRLSVQDFDCYKNNVCDPGDPAKAFQYWIDHGLVSLECKPYDTTALEQGVCEEKCKNGQDYFSDKHKGTSQSLLNPDDHTIKKELFKNGPIQAGFDVYEDFLYHYKSGVYSHKFGRFMGKHSVRVLGYGVENGEKYWLGVNTWAEWGDNGYFKIKRFTDVKFEDYMIAGFP